MCDNIIGVSPDEYVYLRMKADKYDNLIKNITENAKLRDFKDERRQITFDYNLLEIIEEFIYYEDRQTYDNLVHTLKGKETKKGKNKNE